MRALTVRLSLVRGGNSSPSLTSSAGSALGDSSSSSSFKTDYLILWDSDMFPIRLLGLPPTLSKASFSSFAFVAGFLCRWSCFVSFSNVSNSHLNRVFFKVSLFRWSMNASTWSYLHSKSYILTLVSCDVGAISSIISSRCWGLISTALSVSIIKSWLNSSC